MKSACDYLTITTPPLVRVEYDAVTGNNLIADTSINKDTPVVIYYGKIIRDDRENVELYMQDPEDYTENVAPYIRGNNNGLHCVDASDLIKHPSTNLNLMGVYVNDYMKLESTSDSDIKNYLSSRSKCNLRVGSDTRDYPVYIAERDIRRGEQLSVHYGLAYWLLQLGVHPSEIRNFMSL